mgnify:CR=1 FL=1
MFLFLQQQSPLKLLNLLKLLNSKQKLELEPLAKLVPEALKPKLKLNPLRVKLSLQKAKLKLNHQKVKPKLNHPKEKLKLEPKLKPKLKLKPELKRPLKEKPRLLSLLIQLKPVNLQMPNRFQPVSFFYYYSTVLANVLVASASKDTSKPVSDPTPAPAVKEKKDDKGCCLVM